MAIELAIDVLHGHFKKGLYSSFTQISKYLHSGTLRNWLVEQNMGQGTTISFFNIVRSIKIKRLQVKKNLVLIK